MRQERLSVNQIVYRNLKYKPTRTVGLVLLSTILSFLLFGGTVFSQSLQKGMSSVQARLGADLMVVPLENDQEMEALLLKGQPSCFYFKKSTVDKITEIEGIDIITTQFFLTSLSAECCDVAVQLIGFDPNTDFSIQPWISKVYKGSIQQGAVLIGSDINAENKPTIKLFDREYEIAAKLEKTGTGLDQAVFATNDTIELLYQDALAKGQHFLEEVDPEKSISSILIKTIPGYDKNEITKNIRKSLGGVSILQSQNMISGMAKNIKAFVSFFKIFTAIFIVIAIFTLYCIFTVSANERKKEFSVYRIIGATKGKIISILLTEAVYINILGGILGIVIAALFFFPFTTFISDQLGLPYIQLSIFNILVIMMTDLLVIILTGPLACLKSALKAGNAESYLVMREGE